MMNNFTKRIHLHVADGKSIQMTLQCYNGLYNIREQSLSEENKYFVRIQTQMPEVMV